MLEKKMYSLYMAVPLDDHFTQSMDEERFIFFLFNTVISVIIIHHQCHHPSPISHQDRNLPKKRKNTKEFLKTHNNYYDDDDDLYSSHPTLARISPPSAR